MFINMQNDSKNIYDDIAEDYSKIVDIKPFHIMYKQHNMIKYLDKKVIDLGLVDI